MSSQGVRKTRSRRPTRGRPNTRLEQAVSSQIGIQEQSQSANSPSSDLQPRKSWEDVLAALEKEPLAHQVQRYKEWKRNGSPHDNYCRVCFKPDGLEPCFSCRLAFHDDCMPAGWLRTSENQLFCVICVRRGWHTDPPVLTPPASPMMGGAFSGLAAATLATEPNTSTRPSPHLDTAPPDRQPGTFPIHGHKSSDEQAVQAPEMIPDISLDNHDTIENDNTPGPSGPVARRPRKSRYTSLPSDVDASLNVLYRELELNSTLKLQIEELCRENARHIQTVKIRDLSMMALRRELENRRCSDQEHEKLRETAVQLEDAKKEIRELRARNEALEAELQTSKEAGEEAKALVDDWKGKLSQLLNN
ncbi:hypothetical protein BO94DRAFT_510192 [Aspergillus sclerotioniger CBS 115572]|uniref:Zinc finger PHD-type domain-containing protein n=1 Tax=Aspergillus sclerotioniger CBS 115572 TaxID=1450535 RepID=A0A317X667_9EURO|nr:hypothetical protein BO94DRAFT_510192 [Aspergillus sclerotioniger CBS 115572]PWY94073.1 hypothetical protein BO94DRAFT_510192 [Aspergillus sclerotioniger CBS 115572]